MAISPDRKHGVIVEINCNTDFAAKNETVGKIAATAAAKLLANPDRSTGRRSRIKDATGQCVPSRPAKTSKSAAPRSLNTETGAIGSYRLHRSRKGQKRRPDLAGGKADDDLFRNIGMHIVAARPLAMTRQDVSPEMSPRKKKSPSSRPKPPASHRRSPRKSPMESSTAFMRKKSCSIRNISTPKSSKDRSRTF